MGNITTAVSPPLVQHYSTVLDILGTCDLQIPPTSRRLIHRFRGELNIRVRLRRRWLRGDDIDGAILGLLDNALVMVVKGSFVKAS